MNGFAIRLSKNQNSTVRHETVEHPNIATLNFKIDKVKVFVAQ